MSAHETLRLDDVILPDRLRRHLREEDRGYPTPCWVTDLAPTRFGYIRVKFNGRQSQMMHRLTYEDVVGPVPDGLELDHLCRVRECANPWHLDAVPRKVNILRGQGFAAVNARKTHCLRGHELAGANLSVRQQRGSEVRVCLTCEAARSRKSRSLKGAK